MIRGCSLPVQTDQRRYTGKMMWVDVGDYCTGLK